MRRRPQRLEGVHGATVAAEANDRPLGVRQLHTDRTGKPDAERAAGRLEEGSRQLRRQPAGQFGGMGERFVEQDRVFGRCFASSSAKADMRKGTASRRSLVLRCAARALSLSARDPLGARPRRRLLASVIRSRNRSASGAASVSDR